MEKGFKHFGKGKLSFCEEEGEKRRKRRKIIRGAKYLVRLRGGQGKGGICIYWEYVPEEGIFGLFEEKKETEKEKKENLLNKEKLLSAWLF